MEQKQSILTIKKHTLRMPFTAGKSRGLTRVLGWRGRAAQHFQSFFILIFKDLRDKAY